MNSSSAAMPRRPGRSAMTIAVIEIVSETRARVSPSDSAASGAMRRSCISAMAWTSAPTLPMATAAIRPPRPWAENVALRCWYVAMASQAAPMT